MEIVQENYVRSNEAYKMSAIVGAANAIGGAAVTAANSVGWFIPMLVAAVAYYQYEEIMSPESRPIDIPTEHLLDEYVRVLKNKHFFYFFCEIFTWNERMVDFYRIL